MENSIDINSLADEWVIAKNKLNKAKDELLSIEENILAEVGILNAGSNKVGECLTITTKVSTSYDQEALEVLSKKVDKNFFPFKVQYKPDNKKMDVLKDMHPDLFKEIARAATTKPAKPAFSYKPPKS